MERLINHNDTQVDQVKINIDLLYPSPLNSFEVDDINDLAENIRYFGSYLHSASQAQMRMGNMRFWQESGGTSPFES